MTAAAKTLFLAFEKGEIGHPDDDSKWVFLNASIPGNVDRTLIRFLRCEQHDRGLWLDLSDKHAAFLDREEGEYAGGLVLLTKHKRENQTNIIRANEMVADGGKILVAGDKAQGISSIRKWVSQRTEVGGSLAKNHATVFWFDADVSNQWDTQVERSEIGEFETAPGMFSAGKIDTGSALLAEFINDQIMGDVADFGAGWGYLSHKIAAKAAPKSLELFESHLPSLEAARTNLVKITDFPIGYNWTDLTREPVSRRFDHIIMNPPFHTGRQTERSLGEMFIEAAAKSLKPGGNVLLVANTGLQYEHKLNACFKNVQLLQRRDGFKVFRAR